MKVFGDIRSGNCYKVALVCRQLDIPFDWVAVDVFSGETRKPPFLAMNPNGRTPVVQLDDGRYLWESNAIISYLAEGSALLPDDAFARAKVLQWLFFEQYSHEPCIAVARSITRFLGNPPERAAELATKIKGGYQALEVMEKQLSETRYMAGDACTIADIALYAYTHTAEESGFNLERFPRVRAWLEQVSRQSGHVTTDNALG